jgi:DNA invertase Pin-like site-specific DNA recombinase
MMMNIGYARVSGATGQQGGLETQITALESAGCEQIYSESISGKNKDRPELKSMIKALRKGDVVTITKIDRLARSMSDFFKLTEEIKESGAGLVSLDGAIDTSDSSPCKELLWQLLASIAEFERKLIFQRCEDGRARAKSEGKHLGRHSKTTKQQDEQMKLAHDQGQSYAQIGKTFGISRMSVYRRLKGHIEAKKESETPCKKIKKADLWAR